MTNKHTRRGDTQQNCLPKGFTLIELLVAVLIIGLLAAVALPQYNKAVKKAQGREVLVALDALEKGISSYYLTHGFPEGTITSEDLDITVPELKYFNYQGSNSKTVATIYIEEKGTRGINSRHFESTLQIGTDPSVSLFWIENGSPVRVCSWACGKPWGSGRSCDECKKYFDCKSMQVGTSIQDCVL